MDNNAFIEEDNTIYDNHRVTPDIINQEAITCQPSKSEPINTSAAKDGNDISSDGGDGKRGDRVCSVDGGQRKREWTSDLFYSVTGKPHNRLLLDNVKQAGRDCCCLPPMMCSLAKRLGEPPFLPFLPGTSTAVRFKVRVLGGISGSIGKDCVVTSCCWPCAMCQMYRELEDIGL